MLRRKTQRTAEILRYSNATGNVGVSLIWNDMLQGNGGEISWGLEALRKAKQEKEMYEKEIYSNQISKLSRAAVFRDKI